MGTGGAAGAPVDCSQPQASAARLRVLTESQYDHTVLDLFQVGGDPAHGLGLGTDDISLEQRANVAAQVATDAVANLSAWAPCTGTSASCEQQIVDDIGAKAYRHPLSDAERTELQALFDAGVASKDFATGVEWFLTGLLQSPDFMYEVVRPDSTEQPGEVRSLSPYEYATRLAYFLWDGPPDDALTTAADTGQLSDATQQSAQIDRMLADSRFSRGVTQFYSQWLHTSGFAELARDATGFDQTVVSALQTSLFMSVTDLYSSPNPSFDSLFSGDEYFLNDALRQFYGMPGTGTAFTVTAMTGQSRHGLLTHPAFMALLARPKESNPISRGIFLLRDVLCINVDPPPQGVAIPALPPVADGVSTRQRLEMHASQPACAGCHGMIDPAGFVFESFDEVGRFRTMDHGVPVDTSGALDLGTDVDGAFATGDELLAKLGDSQTVRACFAQHYLDFALSHPVPDPADTCSFQAVSQSFGANGDLKQLVTSIASSDSFRMRLAEGVGK